MYSMVYTSIAPRGLEEPQRKLGLKVFGICEFRPLKLVNQYGAVGYSTLDAHTVKFFTSKVAINCRRAGPSKFFRAKFKLRVSSQTTAKNLEIG